MMDGNVTETKEQRLDKTTKTRCKTCNRPYDKRLRRSPLVKYLLFFLPLRKYYCSTCHVTRYVRRTWEERF